jgi:hypothetical protein
MGTPFRSVYDRLIREPWRELGDTATPVAGPAPAHFRTPRSSRGLNLLMNGMAGRGARGAPV